MEGLTIGAIQMSADAQHRIFETAIDAGYTYGIGIPGKSYGPGLVPKGPIDFRASFGVGEETISLCQGCSQRCLEALERADK